MKCYLINLDRSQDRLAWFLKATDGFDLDIVRIAAVDGRCLAEAEIVRWSSYKRDSYRLTAEEIGCFLSHRAVWRAAAQGEDDWVFVAEDDIHFGHDAHYFFSNPGWQPADADLVKAETFRSRTAVAIRPTDYAYGHKLRRLPSVHFGTAAYFLRKSAAAKLVELTQEVCGQVDGVLFEPRYGVAGAFKRYQIDPAICVQDSLLKSEDRIGLESTLEDLRRRNSGDDFRDRKSTGVAKLKRRTARPFILLRQIALSLSRGAVFKRIPYSDDH